MMEPVEVGGNRWTNADESAKFDQLTPFANFHLRSGDRHPWPAHSVSGHPLAERAGHREPIDVAFFTSHHCTRLFSRPNGTGGS
jgi:hypothetical protein